MKNGVKIWNNDFKVKKKKNRLLIVKTKIKQRKIKWSIKNPWNL